MFSIRDTVVSMTKKKKKKPWLQESNEDPWEDGEKAGYQQSISVVETLKF